MRDINGEPNRLDEAWFDIEWLVWHQYIRPLPASLRTNLRADVTNWMDGNSGGGEGGQLAVDGLQIRYGDGDVFQRFVQREDDVLEGFVFTSGGCDADVAAEVACVELCFSENLLHGAGMTKQEVELAFGPPCAFRTTSPALDTWCFWTEFLVGKRIIFTRGVVSEILVL